MKRLVTIFVTLGLAGAALSCSAQALKEPDYASKKPLYAFVVLDEAATKVLKVVFDESQGTGKGYDTVYADLNLNGDLTDDKPMKAPLERQGVRTSCTFRPVDVEVPYNELGKGTTTPWQVGFEYTRYQYEGAAQATVQFWLRSTIKLKDASGEWQYSSGLELFPVESPKGAVAIALWEKPVLTIAARPDQEKKGNTGIAAYLESNRRTVECSKAGAGVTARLRIVNEEGKSVHTDHVTMDRLVFG